MHPVFTVAQLEPVPDPKEDIYTRPVPRPDESPSVFIEGDTEDYKSYYLDRILNKRVIKKGRGYATEYLVKWKGYGPEHDTWRNVKTLDDAMDLVKDYEEALRAPDKVTIAGRLPAPPSSQAQTSTRQTLLEVRIPVKTARKKDPEVIAPSKAPEAETAPKPITEDSQAKDTDAIVLRRSPRNAGA